MRKRLKDSEAEHLGFDIRERNADNRNPRYQLTEDDLAKLMLFRSNDVKTVSKSNTYETPFVLSAWSDEGTMMDIDEYCQHYKLPKNDIVSYKLVSHTGTPFYNIVFKENVTAEELLDLEFIDSIVKKHINKKSFSRSPGKIKGDTFDRVVYTDVHVGMTTNGSGNAMYSKDWNKDELYKRCNEMSSYIIESQKSDVLIIDDLGDFLDGWNGETTRKGHKLPQNMTNKEMFDYGLHFKITMIDYLTEYYDTIIVNNVCEDNHSGDFGYVLNSAFKSIIEQKYENVTVTNHVQFMNHYFVGVHAFVISHGKDSHALKFGFKPQLDARQIEKIDQYLKQNKIYQQSEFIEFSKGDSHQMLFDFCTSDDFDYCNYPALSPSSEWVQTNFKKGRSGFVFSTIQYSMNRKEILPYFFYN